MNAGTRIAALFALPVLLALAAPALAVINDSDLDGVSDSADNCINDVNSAQQDNDGDGIGDLCDADFDQNCSVNFLDLGVMKGVFFQSGDLETDMNNDNSTNFLDLGFLKGDFFLAPGPSGVVNNCGLGFVTYTQDTQPIYFNKCDPCHTGLGFGGHNIGINYADALDPASNVNCSGLTVGQCTIVRIQRGEMPRGAGCTGNPAQDAGNPLCTTQAEQDLIQTWIDGALPE